MSKRLNRSWTTLWDRPNRRVLLLAGRRSTRAPHNWWSFVKHDQTASVPGVYDIWREESGDIVFVEVRLDDKDTPLGFPQDLLSRDLLGSQTLWPGQHVAAHLRKGETSFIWWHWPEVDLEEDGIETKQQDKHRASALNVSEKIRAKKARRRAAALKAWETRRAKERMEKNRKVEDRLRYGKIVGLEPLRKGTNAGLAARLNLLDSGVGSKDIASEREFARLFSGEVPAKDCEACAGSGLQSGKPCPVCRGVGRVRWERE